MAWLRTNISFDLLSVGRWEDTIMKLESKQIFHEKNTFENICILWGICVETSVLIDTTKSSQEHTSTLLPNLSNNDVYDMQ